MFAVYMKIFQSQSPGRLVEPPIPGTSRAFFSLGPLTRHLEVTVALSGL